MEKLEIKSGYNQVSVNSNLSGTGSTESPIRYTGDVQHSDKRHLIWESTGNDYNTDITLSEPVTHFDKIMVYGSGLENGDTMHLSKNVYKTQDKLMGCDAWGYSPWNTSFQANYILAANLKISGNSGHIGGSMFWGIGSKNATWAAGKWTGTEAPKMLMPWKIFGIDRKPTYNFFPLTSEGGSVSSNINPGYSGDIATITVIPNGDEWKQSALNITGATLTGNDFMFENSNVTAQAEFEHSRDLTLVPNEHATLSADKMTGFSGDIVTVDATTDEGWYFTGLNVTGATATGNQFMFVGENVTAEGLYTDEGYPITYIVETGGTFTGDTDIYVPGSEGIQLTTSYDTYWRFSGYEVTGGTIENNVLIPTGPCTAKAVFNPNYFTASGGWEKGSNVQAYRTTTNVPQKYATASYKTSNVPTSWYATSNRWKPADASAYQITLHPIMKFSAGNGSTIADAGGATGVTLIGSTQSNAQGFSLPVAKNGGTYSTNYNKTFTSNVQNVTYGISGKLYYPGGNHYGTAMYVATGTTGTWTATGIAP